MDILLQVLLWVGLAFLAGFIGQFGKSLTLRLLEKRRLNRERETPIAAAENGASEKARGKIEKKRAKAELKDRKKDRQRPETRA